MAVIRFSRRSFVQLLPSVLSLSSTRSQTRFKRVVFILCCCMLFIQHGTAFVSPFIRRYQSLNYDTDQLHQRVRRAAVARSSDGLPLIDSPSDESRASSKPVVFKINTLDGKILRLKLYPDETTFTSDHALFDGKNVQRPAHVPFLYEGYVFGHKNSYVHGSIRDGIFEGKIYLPDESYIVEPVRRYSKNETFHSIIYSERDVIHPDQLNRPVVQHPESTLHVTLATTIKEAPINAESPLPNHSTCGYSDTVKKWMDSVQNAAVSSFDKDQTNACDNPSPLLKSADLSSPKAKLDAQCGNNAVTIRDNLNAASNDTESNPVADSVTNAEAVPFASIYSLSSRRFIEENYERLIQREKNAGLHDPYDADFSVAQSTTQNYPPLNRTRRSISIAQSQVDRKRVCRMYIQTDSFLWRHIIETERTTARARDEILSMIASHVKAISAIYQSYDFGGVRGIKFAVQRTTINDTDYCIENRNEDPFCKRHVDVSNLLSYNSLANHSDFCLAYLFTYRDFVGGTLGLAWVASPNGPSGGICEKYKLFSETRDGVRIRGWKSLNTGVITFVNYGSRVPPTVSHLTLAHEVGHNFGAPHDPAACQPNGPLGNYIMYPSATSGDKPNNRKFSDCSLEKMTAVVQSVVNEFNGKRNCFAATDEAFCGNKIVEEGEVCDCGYNSQECKEKCCYPAVMHDSDYKEQGQACTLRRRPTSGLTVNCSPSQGPCCTENCTFFGDPILCKHETECAQAATCTGSSPHCPRAIPKQNLSLCANSTRVCLNGECSGSLCLLLGMEECFLTHERLPAGVIGQEMMCFVACQEKGKPSTCRSTYNDELEFPKSLLPLSVLQADDGDNTTSGVRLKPGSPCNNYRGYCDIFHRCRRVDSEGPLERITKFVLDERTLRGVTQWARDNWWEAVLVLLAALLFTGCFIKCCAVHTPSSNPKKKRHRTLHDDWETLSTTIRRHGRSGHGGGGSRGHQRRRQGESSSSAAAAVAAANAAAAGAPAASGGEPVPLAGNNNVREGGRRQRSRQRRSRDNRRGGAETTSVPPAAINNNADERRRREQQRETEAAVGAPQRRTSSGGDNNRVRGRRDDRSERRGAAGQQQQRGPANAAATRDNNDTAQLPLASMPQSSSNAMRANNASAAAAAATNAAAAAAAAVAARQNSSNSERVPLFMPNSVSSGTTVQQIIPDSPPPTYHEAMQTAAVTTTASAVTATAITTTTVPAAAASAPPPSSTTNTGVNSRNAVTSTTAAAVAPPLPSRINSNTAALHDEATVPFLYPFVLGSAPPALPTAGGSTSASTNVVDLLLMMPGIHTTMPLTNSSSNANNTLLPDSAIQQRPLPPLPPTSNGAVEHPNSSSATTTTTTVPSNGKPSFLSNIMRSSTTTTANAAAAAASGGAAGVQLPPAGHRKNRRDREAEKAVAVGNTTKPSTSNGRGGDADQQHRSSRDKTNSERRDDKAGADRHAKAAKRK